jgi:hypothetical protein
MIFAVNITQQLSIQWPPLWSSGQSSWLQIQKSAFNSWRYQIFWEVVGLERGPLSLVSTIKELLERNSSGSGLEIREYGRKGSVTLTTRHPLHPQKLALTSQTIGGRSVGIVRSRTQAMEFFYRFNYNNFSFQLSTLLLLHFSSC